MWKQVGDYIEQIFALQQETQKDKADIKADIADLRQEVKEIRQKLRMLIGGWPGWVAIRSLD